MEDVDKKYSESLMKNGATTILLTETNNLQEM